VSRLDLNRYSDTKKNEKNTNEQYGVKIKLFSLSDLSIWTQKLDKELNRTHSYLNQVLIC